MDPRLTPVASNMASKQNPAKTFNGMTYREVQKHNSTQRSQLPKVEQKQIKQAGLRNVGWLNVIDLYNHIETLQAKLSDELPNLETLFLEADRIGNKYQTDAERQAFTEKMAAVSTEMSEIIDQQFPDTEAEIISFKGKQKTNKHSKKNR